MKLWIIQWLHHNSWKLDGRRADGAFFFMNIKKMEYINCIRNIKSTGMKLLYCKMYNQTSVKRINCWNKKILEALFLEADAANGQEKYKQTLKMAEETKIAASSLPVSLGWPSGSRQAPSLFTRNSNIHSQFHRDHKNERRPILTLKK